MPSADWPPPLDWWPVCTWSQNGRTEHSGCGIHSRNTSSGANMSPGRCTQSSCAWCPSPSSRRHSSKHERRWSLCWLSALSESSPLANSFGWRFSSLPDRVFFWLLLSLSLCCPFSGDIAVVASRWMYWRCCCPLHWKQHILVHTVHESTTATWAHCRCHSTLRQKGTTQMWCDEDILFSMKPSITGN